MSNSPIKIMPAPLRIISRKSTLALLQSDLVIQELTRHYPHLDCKKIAISTKGDQMLDRSLALIGGKGLFIKELEEYLLAKVADIAVHSLKDITIPLANKFALVAILRRDDPSDCLVANHYKSIEEMPQGAVIGTSSARRKSLLQHFYPHLTVKLLRGNIDTRLAKLDNQEYDGIILATAGLIRLGLAHRITQRQATNKFVPAIGQGAIAVEALKSTEDSLFVAIDHKLTALAVMIERAIGEKLAVTCATPVGVYASFTALMPNDATSNSNRAQHNIDKEIRDRSVSNNNAHSHKDDHELKNSRCDNDQYYRLRIDAALDDGERMRFANHEACAALEYFDQTATLDALVIAVINKLQ